MQQLQNTTGSLSHGETSWDNGDSQESFKTVIVKANSVPFNLLFKYYNLHLDDCNTKIICPFPDHSNGQENSASFKYYPNTNSFWCFGCKKGSAPVDFVCFIEKVKRSAAADKILKLFNSELDKDFIFNKEDFASKNKLLLDFSEYIRNLALETSLEEAEKKTRIFDLLYEKYHLSNEAIESLILKLKER
jgi:hypothetical protein